MTQANTQLILPGEYVTDAERREQERNAPGLGQGIADAIMTEQAIPWFARQLGTQQYEADPDFTLDQDLLTELSDGLPDDMIDAFTDARSLEHARHIRRQMLDVNERRQRLSQMGWTGAGLRLGAAILDPAAIGVGVLSEGTLAPLVIGSKLNTFQRFVRGGLVFGGTEMAFESYLVSQDPQRDGRDILYAGAGGMVLGGGATALLTRPMNNLRKATVKADLEDAGIQLTEKGVRQFDTSADDLRVRRDILREAGVDADNLSDEQVNELVTFQREPDIINNGADLSFADMPTPPKADDLIGKMRYPLMQGRLQMSPSPTARKAGRAYTQDSIAGARAGDVSNQSAINWKGAEKGTRMRDFIDQMNIRFRDYSKRTGVKLAALLPEEIRFRQEATKAVRRPAGTYTDDPDINALADLFRKKADNLLFMGKRYGTRGLEEVESLETYAARLYSQPRLQQVVHQYGQESVEELFYQAFMRHHSDLDPQAGRRVAKGMVRTIQKTKDRTSLSKAMALQEGGADELRSILRENVEGITPEEIEDIVALTHKKQESDAITGRAKKRVDLDETTSIRVVDRNGKEGVLHFEDILENDILTIMNKMHDDILGAAAATQLYNDFGVKGIDELKSVVRAELAEAGASDDAIEDTLANLEVFDRVLRGIPLNENTRFSRVLQRLRSVNFMRVMGQAGWPQLADLGSAIGEYGFGNVMMSAMPAMKSLVEKARTGRITNEALDELEPLVSAGYYPDDALMRWDGSGETSPLGTAADQWMRVGQKTVANLSGMRAIDAVLKKTSVLASIARWNQIAASGKLPSAARLGVIGLDEKRARAIIDQINEHGSFKEGFFGRKVRRLNIEEWADKNAASDFIASMEQWAARGVQQGDVGSLARWMTKDLGKVIVQFRSFGIRAYEHHLLFGLQMRDMQVFQSWASSMLIGGLAYIGIQYSNAIGRSDQDEYLARRLTPSEIGKGAFLRAGFSSLIPTAADTVLPIAGFDQQFSYGRSTQLATNLFLGNPTIDFLNNVPMSARALVAPARPDYEFSQQDLRGLRGVLPFQNIMGVNNVLNTFQGNLPRSSQNE